MKSTLFCFFLIAGLFMPFYAEDALKTDEVNLTKAEKEKLKNIKAQKPYHFSIRNILGDIKDLFKLERTIIPLPIFSTDPNSGQHYGLGLGALLYDEEDEIRHIFAPYVHYNEYSEIGFTIRYLMFPSASERYYGKISRSHEINDELLMEYRNKKFYFDRLSVFGLVNLYDESSARFYGLGGQSEKSQESNYTHREYLGQFKIGTYLDKYLDVSLAMQYQFVDTLKGAVKNVPQLSDLHSEVFGIGGQAVLSSTFKISCLLDEVKYFPAFKLKINGWLTPSLVMHGEDISYTKWGADLVCDIPVIQDNLILSGRFLYEAVDKKSVPFFDMPSLGGSKELRGYNLGRFYDQAKVLGIIEARWGIGSLSLMGFKSNWELTPFFEAGMVDEDIRRFNSNHLKTSGGLGVRVRLSESVLVRLDMGYSEEGLKAHIDFGYPF